MVARISKELYARAKMHGAGMSKAQLERFIAGQDDPDKAIRVIELVHESLDAINRQKMAWGAALFDALALQQDESLAHELVKQWFTEVQEAFAAARRDIAAKRKRAYGVPPRD